MRQKVTTALASGEYPDIAYIFGWDLANLARSDKVLDLTDDVKKPDFHWDDFYAPAKAATTVDGKVRALPALIDDLAVVYNKKLFKQLGVPEPPHGWTWEEFAATSKQLTDKSKGTFGTALAGGRRRGHRVADLAARVAGRRRHLTRTARSASAASPASRRSASHRLAQDGSVYVDTKPDSDQTYQLFNNGKIGMVITGPWQLPDFIEAKIDFGVAPLPTFGGEPLTISGPDTWTLFDNGDKRSKAAIEFIQWLNRPSRTRSGSRRRARLPLRKGTAEQAVWKDYQKQIPGLSSSSPGSTARARSRRTPPTRRSPRRWGSRWSPSCSKRSSPQDALQQAVQTSEGVLAGGG